LLKSFVLQTPCMLESFGWGHWTPRALEWTLAARARVIPFFFFFLYGSTTLNGAVVLKLVAMVTQALTITRAISTHAADSLGSRSTVVEVFACRGAQAPAGQHTKSSPYANHGTQQLSSFAYQLLVLVTVSNWGPCQCWCPSLVCKP
jgi:hypothetical protein